MSYQVRIIRNRYGSPASPLLYQRWWRCEKYHETDDYIQMYQGVPRWVQRHFVLAYWNAQADPKFTHGADAPIDMSEYGPQPLKIVFPKVEGNVFSHTVKLRLTCIRVDGGEEVNDVTIPQGACHPRVIRLKPACQMRKGDGKDYPWAGVGLCKDVTNIEPVGEVPEGMVGRLRVVNDVPGLAHADGRALQLTNLATVQWDGCLQGMGERIFAAQDLIRGFFVFYVQDGQIWHKRRHCPEGDWVETKQDSEGEHDNAYPTAVFDEHRRLWLCWQRDDDVVIKSSHDYGRNWSCDPYGGEPIVIVTNATCPFMEYDARNNLCYFLYWQDGNLKLRRSSDFGQNFLGTAQTVKSDVDEQQATVIRDTEHGHLFVVYQDADETQRVLKSTDDGMNWEEVGS